MDDLLKHLLLTSMKGLIIKENPNIPSIATVTGNPMVATVIADHIGFHVVKGILESTYATAPKAFSIDSDNQYDTSVSTLFFPTGSAPYPKIYFNHLRKI
jgi:hypothetical protein